MKRLIRLHIERLPEGVYLATSADVRGLVTQAPTLAECIEWARENARIMLELQGNRNSGVTFAETLDVQVPVQIAA